MTPSSFIRSYETALKAQDWKKVDPLIAEEAVVVFSNGAIHRSKRAIQRAFEVNFSVIKNETFLIENVRWVRKEKNFAIYLFDFSWKGLVKGQPASGEGLGTTVIIKENEQWKLLSEHLGRKAP